MEEKHGEEEHPGDDPASRRSRSSRVTMADNWDATHDSTWCARARPGGQLRGPRHRPLRRDPRSRRHGGRPQGGSPGPRPEGARLAQPRAEGGEARPEGLLHRPDRGDRGVLRRLPPGREEGQGPGAAPAPGVEARREGAAVPSRRGGGPSGHRGHLRGGQDLRRVPRQAPPLGGRVGAGRPRERRPQVPLGGVPRRAGGRRRDGRTPPPPGPRPGIAPPSARWTWRETSPSSAPPNPTGNR